MEYTYTEEDLKQQIRVMENNGCLPPMAYGEWGLLNDGGIGHYYLCLKDFEKANLMHSHTMLGENVDAAYLALIAIDRLRILTFAESKEGVARQAKIWAQIMEEE